MNYYDLMLKLKQTPGRLDKIAILKQFKTDVVLTRIFKLGLDNLIRFNIRKIPEYIKNLDSLSLTEAMESLTQLSDRTITGNAGVEYLKNILSSLTFEDAKVIEMIIEGDFKCGVQSSTVNKIWPKLISDYPILLASGYDKKLIDKIKLPAYIQRKSDGMRANAHVRNRQVEFFSRNGNRINLSGALEKELIDAYNENDCVFDGELIVIDSAGNVLPRKISNGIINKNEKTDDEINAIRFEIWDWIPYQNWTERKYDIEYQTRYQHLQNLLGTNDNPKYKTICIMENKEVSSLTEAQAEFEASLVAGHEGIILKSKTMIWEDKRSRSQIKFKAELDCDLLCTGYNPGDGIREGYIGSLQLESSDGLIKVNCGSGMTEQDFKKNPDEYVGKIIEIVYNEKIVNSKGEVSLFLPVFHSIRTDKSIANSAKEIK